MRILLLIATLLLIALPASAEDWPSAGGSSLQSSAEFLEAGVSGISATMTNPNDADEDGTLLNGTDPLDCNSGRCIFLGADGDVYTYDDHDSAGVGAFWRKGEEQSLLRYHIVANASWAGTAGTGTCLNLNGDFSPAAKGNCNTHANFYAPSSDWYITRMVAVTTALIGIGTTNGCKIILSVDNTLTPTDIATLNVPDVVGTTIAGAKIEQSVGAIFARGTDLNIGLQIGDGDFSPDTTGPAVCPSTSYGFWFELYGVPLGD